MAFNGNLVTFGGYTIPMDLMKLDSYKVTYSTQDLDSYRDLDGKLHRNALANKVGKVEFNTPYITGRDLETLMSGIRGGYSDSKEKKGSCTFFVPELNSYVTQDMYVPDITYQIYHIQEDGDLLYNSVRIAFIGY